jgi:hypothetical protein
MLNGLKQFLFLVVDQETKGILTKCSSMNTANAVSKGILNSSPMLVPYPYLNHDVKNYNFDCNLNYKLVRKTNFPEKLMASEMSVYAAVTDTNTKNIFELVPISANDLWLEKRKLANFRSLKMEFLEVTCERYMSRIKNYTGDELFFQYLGKQLDLVNIEIEYFPDGIKEWAEINEVSNNAAYYELKMIYDSLGITMFRIHALWTKYVEQINKTFSEEDFEKMCSFSHIESEFKFGKK